MAPHDHQQAGMGLIAGSGAYPLAFARAARRERVARLSIAAFHGETDPALASLGDATEWFRVGQLSRMIRFFHREGIDRVVMAGQIAPKNLFDLRPDLRTLRMLARLKQRNAESLFGAIGEELDSEKITLLPATTFLEDLLPPPGPVCGPGLKKRQWEDAAYGFRIAKETSRLDIGQTVVVKNGTVLAVEAFEGTNEAMRRGGKLGKGDAMMIKVSKPDQDFRFDVPVVGPATVETAADAGVAVLIIEAGKTLLLEGDRVASLCRSKGITIHAWSEED